MERLLGVDYGRVYLGLAVSESNLFRPLAVIKSRSDDYKIEEIKKVCDKEKITKVVIGITDGKLANTIKGFSQRLKMYLGIPVVGFDESLTSHDALALMINDKVKKDRRKLLIHSYSAIILLKLYLESVQNGFDNRSGY